MVPSRVPSSLLTVTCLVIKPQRLVGHTGRHGDGGDFGIEQASHLGCASLLAGGAVFVHGFAADVVAFGHLLGGLQRAP